MKEYRSLNEQLRELYGEAKRARDAANRAYTIALRNRKNDNDSREAFATVMYTNEVMDHLYEMMTRYI